MSVTALNRPILAASGLLVVTALTHAFVGGPEVNAPVQSSGLDPVVRAVSAVVWHALTALFLVLAAALAWAARHSNPLLIWVTLALNLAFIAIFAAIGLVALGNLSEMPQWTLFVAISLCLLIGLRRRD
ncbi:MAG: hypothetical protein AAGK71_13835 [Pseudomonadota bacterium]